MLLNFMIDDDGFRCTNASDIMNTEFVSYLKCHFDFKAEAWKEVATTVAIFKSATYNETAEVLLDSNGDCYIDPEVYKRGGIVQVKLVGDRYKSSGEAISSSHITDIIEFEVNNNITMPTPIPSKYDVFVAELETARQSITVLIDEVQVHLDNGDFDGDDGVGISDVEYNADGTLTVTLTDGTSFTSEFSMKGEQGDNGEDGVGIADVVYGDDGTLTITLTDGSTFTSEFSLKGERGPQGDTGPQGDPGVQGETGNGIASIEKTGTVGYVDTYTITFTDGSTTTYTVTNGRNGTGSVADVWVNGVSVLDEDIAKIDMGVVEFTVPKTSVLDSGGLRGVYYKASGRVRLEFSGIASSAISIDDVLFTVPEEYRPSDTKGGPCFCANQNGNTWAGSVSIHTDGTIRQRVSSYCRTLMGFIEYTI